VQKFLKGGGLGHHPEIGLRLAFSTPRSLRLKPPFIQRVIAPAIRVRTGQAPEAVL